jgi:hypothetical protein
MCTSEGMSLLRLTPTHCVYAFIAFEETNPCVYNGFAS